MHEQIPFPEALDSTILGSYKSCSQKAFRTYLQHWKPQSESVHLVAGKAFARGLEVAREVFYIQGASPSEAVEAGGAALLAEYGDFSPPDDSAKSASRMLGALVFYFDQYPLGTDSAIPITLGTKRGIEFSFAEPLPVTHPVTGNPILYTGRCDMLADWAGGVYAFDEKTTSSLGPSWSKQWDMRSQFTGYCWAARQIGVPVAGAIVRGVSILKTKYDTQQAITYRPDWFVDRWLDQTVQQIQLLIEEWENYNDHGKAFRYNLDHACAEYGGCSLTRICNSEDPETWLEAYFEKRVWDPIHRVETKV